MSRDAPHVPNTDTPEAGGEMTLEEIDAEIAALEAKYGTTPNAETIAAMKELDEGGGEVVTMDELKAMLDEIR
jgi:threonine aldolase